MSYQEKCVVDNISHDKVKTYIRWNFVVSKYKNKCLESLKERDMFIFENYIRILEHKHDYGKKIRKLLKTVNLNYTTYDIYSYTNCDHIINYLYKITKMAEMNKYDKNDIDFELCNIYLFHYLRHNEIYESYD